MGKVPGIGYNPASTEPQAPAASPARTDLNISRRDFNDLVNTIIAEAGGDGVKGMVGVANVINNRSRNLGKSVGEVVRAPKQFEGYENPGEGSRRMMQDPQYREQAAKVAYGVLSGQLPDVTGGADHFHAKTMMPSWAKKMPQTTTIGGHIFYNSGQKPHKSQVSQSQHDDGQLAAFAPEPQKQPAVQVIDDITTASVPSQPDEDSAANATRFLLPRLKGHEAEHITGMQPDFRVNLARMFQDAPPDIAKGLQIFSGHRTPERQAELFQGALKKYGSVAKARKNVAPPPGLYGSKGSNHNHGFAADLQWNGVRIDKAPARVRNWLHQNAGKYGLAFPLGHEAWHVELAGIRKGQRPKATHTHTAQERNADAPPSPAVGLAFAGAPMLAGLPAKEEEPQPEVMNDPAGFYKNRSLSPAEPEPKTELSSNSVAQDAEFGENAVAPQQAQQIAKSLGEGFEVIPASELENYQKKWADENQSKSFLGDIPLLLGTGVQGLTDSVWQGIKAIPGIGKPIYGAVSWLEKGVTGKTPEENSRANLEYAAARLSPETQKARQKEWMSETWQPGEAWRDWRSYAAGITESLPSTAATMVPAGWFARGAYASALGRGLGELAAHKAAVKTATLAGALGEGFITGGAAAKAVADEMDALPRRVFEQSEAVRSLVAQGRSLDDAIAVIKSDAESQAMLIGGVAGAAFGGMGDRVLAKIIMEKRGGTLTRRVLQGMVREGIAEGIFEEMPQEAGQQMAQNRAMQSVEPDRSIWKDVPDAAAGGLAIGGAMGAGMGGGASIVSGHRPIRNAVEYGREAQEGQNTAQAQPVMERPAQKPDNSWRNTTNELQVGARVRIVAEGVEPFEGQITGWDNGLFEIFDSDTGEVMMAPAEEIERVTYINEPEEAAPPVPDAEPVGALAQQVAAESRPVPNAEPVGIFPRNKVESGFPEGTIEDEYAQIAPQVEAYAPEQTRQPPTGKAKQTRLKKPISRAGQSRNVIVAMPDGQRFVARVVEWEDNGALVKRNDGTDLWVPIENLFEDGRSAKEIEAEEHEINPPIERETATGKLIRHVFGKSVELPDSLHARLYDLGTNRKLEMGRKGQTAFEINQNPPHEQTALAKEFAVTPQAIGQMADHYQHSVAKAGKEARSKLPVKIWAFSKKQLERFRQDAEQAGLPFDQPSPRAETENTLAQRWKELSLAERKALLDRAKVKRSPKSEWAGFSATIKKKLANLVALADGQKAETPPKAEPAKQPAVPQQPAPKEPEPTTNKPANIIVPEKQAPAKAQPKPEPAPAKAPVVETAANQEKSQTANEYADKWFGSREKAESFIDKKGIGATHEAVLVGKRFEIHPKKAGASHKTEPEQKPQFITTTKLGEGISATIIDPSALRSRAGHERAEIQPKPETAPRQEPKVEATPKDATKPKVEVSENTLFSKKAAEEAREFIRKLPNSKLFSGIDPELMRHGINLAGYHIERGARTFAAYAKAMFEDMGTVVKPYLKVWYQAVKHYPGAEHFDGMSSEEEILKINIDELRDQVSSDKILNQAEQAMREETRKKGEHNERSNDTRRNQSPISDVSGAGTLERVSADDVQVAEEGGKAGRAPERSGNTDNRGNDRAGTERLLSPRVVGNDTGEISDLAGGRRTGGTNEQSVSANSHRTPEAKQRNTVEGDSYHFRPERDRGQSDEKPAAGLTAQQRPDDLFTITAEDRLGEGGQKTKFRANIDAIQIIKALDKEQRIPSHDEQRQLARWVGWGGLSQAFYREDGTTTKGWEKEAAELKALLTAEEYRAAQSSTRNAHYTSPEVVKAMWKAAKRLGLRGGQILEPAVGAGNFLGLMPPELRKATQITGVELDHITGHIAKNLYPKANIHAPLGFQELTVPDGYFDMVIGNPPFGSERLYDANRRHLNNFSIHNYFFAKAVDSLRPNGVALMVVTNSFLDASTDTARQYIAKHADLVAAIRLPNNAFAKNAGTEVTTDIIILKKRADGDETANTSWLEIGTYKDSQGRDVPLNRYFLDNPDMMLGDFGAYGSMYRENAPALIARDGQSLDTLLQEALARLPQDIMPEPGALATPEKVTVADNIRDTLVGSYFLDKDGTILIREPDILNEPQAVKADIAGEKSKERISGMIRLRDAFARLRAAQLDEHASDEKIDNLRERLNKVYDAFVKKNDLINTSANMRVFRQDPTWPQIAALEEGFQKAITKTVAARTGEEPRAASAQKAAIFSKRTQHPYKTPDSAATAKDALALSLSETGQLDLDYMSKLYGKTPDEIISELGNLVYQTPQGEHVTADEYLSGNVRKKLAEAQEAVKENPAFNQNVQALETVIPADIEAVDIDVKAGSPWLPVTDVADFVSHIAGIEKAASVRYDETKSKWSITNLKKTDAAQVQWATERSGLLSILDAALNGTQITVRDAIDSQTTIINQAATEIANEKVSKLKSEWQRWIWNDDNRRQRLARLYNDIFNTVVLRHYDGAHLTLPGKVGDDIIELRPHQKNFVWRVLQSGTTLADHTVGAGKTFALVAAAMELRRMGRAKKPMIVVPNHLVGQWGADFIRLYPGAKVLAATKNDFAKDNRKKFFARIATGDWDAVIVAHSSFGKIDMSAEYRKRFIEQTIADLETSIASAKDEGSESAYSVKDMVKRRDREQEKLKKLQDRGAKDKGLIFDETGVDALFVDEAHEFKNLAFSTSMSRVAGLGNPQGSQKADDLFTKIRFILDQTGGRNIIFATGTPISNSMAEMFTMQRYLDYQGLVEQGLAHFDAWARVFGDVVTDWELSPSGQYKLNSRFAKFVNMPELMQRYLGFADVISNDDIQRQLAERGQTLPIPKVKGGKPEMVIVERSPDQARYIGEPTTDERGNETYPHGSLVYRAENLPTKQAKGSDNMLKVMSDARKAALDMRLIDPAYGDYPASKTNLAVKKIKNLYDKWHKERGTQLVFCDLSTPKKARAKEELRIRDLLDRADQGDEAASEELDKLSPDELEALNGSFSVYDDMKAKLIKAGIPENEVAFIHDANSDEQKQELFGKVRSGRVRVLFGSTAKMGAGTNVQDRLVALHHMDAPWRPSDLEQRDGRGIRQGNKLYETDPEGFELEILRYATKNTLDARQWQTIESKARFVQQVRKGDMKTREVEDIGGEAANAAEMKAAASGNPLILEEMDLRGKVRKLENQQSDHIREQHRIVEKIGTFNNRIASLEKRMPLAIKDAEQAAQIPDTFAMTIEGKAFDTRVDAGSTMLSIAKKMLGKKTETQAIGSYGGFELHWDNEANAYYSDRTILRIKGNEEHEIIVNTATQDAGGLTLKLSNLVRGLIKAPQTMQSDIAYAKEQIAAFEGQKAGWPHEAELKQLEEQHRAIIEQLRPKKQESPKELDTEQADKDAKFSIRTTDGNIASITNELAQGFSGQFINRLLDAGKVKIVEKAPNGVSDVQGWTDSNGTINLVAGAIADGEAQAVLLHEAFHSGVRPLIGDRAWNSLNKELRSLYRQFEQSRGSARTLFDQARARVARAKAAIGDMSLVMEVEEFGAYAIEEYERLPGALRRWVSNVLGQVKAWVLRRFGRQLGQVTPSQLRALAVSALKQQAKTTGTTPITGRTRRNNATNDNRQYSIASRLREKAVRGITVENVIEELKGKLTDLKPALLKTIPLNYFTELAQPNMAAVSDYLKLKRSLDAYRGKKHAEADVIAQSWLKYSRLGKEKVQALSSLMHNATLEGIDPSIARDDSSPAYKRLRQDYLAMPEAGRKIFNTVRDAYAKQSAELDFIILENIEKVNAIAEEKLEAEYNKEIERIKNSRLDDGGKRKAIEEIERAFKTRKQRSFWSLKARILRLRNLFEANRVEGPYFPLARFGNYFVSVSDDEGHVISFSRRERAADRDRLAADMRKAYPGFAVQTGLLSSERDIKEALDPRIIAEIEGILGETVLSMDEASTVIDQIWQRYLQLMPDLSIRKRFIHRKGTAGFDADALRAFSSHMFHAAHQMGKLKYGVELAEFVNKATEQAQEAKDQTRGMQLANELRSRHQWVMKPTGSKFAQTMTSTAFVWYLAATPAAAIVNMSQTPMLGIPILGARFGGLKKAAGAILKATKDSIAGRGSVERANLTLDEQKAMQAFYDSGLIDRTQSHDLAGVGETGVEYSPLRAKVMGIISWMFHRTEVWNREVTALAAYRMAREAGQNVGKAIDTAHDLTWKTHFDYSNSSRPAIMQNDFAKVALVFRSYNINMIYRIARDLHQVFKGESKQARREALHQLAGIFGMMGLFAGTTGMFGFHMAMTLLGAAFGDDDDPFEFEQRYRAAVQDLLGAELGGVILNGVPGHYFGVNLSDRIGLPDIWFRSPTRELQGKAEFDYWIMNSLGASVSMIGDAWRGISLVKEGNIARGIETVAPKWVRDPMKGWRYYNEGLTSLRGDQVLGREEMDAWDIIAQTIGFTPAKIAETWERNSALKNAEQRIVRQRRSLINAWALAVATKDKQAQADASAAIERFNKVPYNHSVIITGQTLRNSFRQRQTLAKKREDGVLIQNPALGIGLRKELPKAIYRN